MWLLLFLFEEFLCHLETIYHYEQTFPSLYHNDDAHRFDIFPLYLYLSISIASLLCTICTCADYRKILCKRIKSFSFISCFYSVSIMIVELVFFSQHYATVYPGNLVHFYIANHYLTMEKYIWTYSKRCV